MNEIHFLLGAITIFTFAALVTVVAMYKKANKRFEAVNKYLLELEQGEANDLVTRIERLGHQLEDIHKELIDQRAARSRSVDRSILSGDDEELLRDYKARLEQHAGKN